MTTFLIERHGQSEANLNRILAGHSDLPLSDQGKLQAKATAEALAGRKIDAIYSSDLCRASRTAQAHLAYHDVPFFAERELREVYAGAWEGRKIQDLIDNDAELYGMWRENFLLFRFPEGESHAEAGQRFGKRLAEIAAQHPDQTILVATHAAVIRAFCAQVLGIAPGEINEKLDYPTNASYSTIVFENGAFRVEEYSHDAHLAGVGVTNFRG